MNLEIGDYFRFTDEEIELIRRARKALGYLFYTVRVDNPLFGRPHTYVIDALVYPNNLRLDFKAHRPGEIGQAFIAPAAGYPLTEELFDGEKFTAEFVANIEEGIEHFRKHMHEAD